MAIYDAVSREPIESPDLEKGYLVDGVIITAYSTEVIENTVTEGRPEGIRHRVPVAESCQWYILNSPEGKSSNSATWEELANAYNEGVMSIGE